MKTLTVAAAALAVVNASAHAESGIASLYSTRELGTKTASGRHLHDRALTVMEVLAACSNAIPSSSRCSNCLASGAVFNRSIDRRRDQIPRRLNEYYLDASQVTSAAISCVSPNPTQSDLRGRSQSACPPG
jgi:hypothetical protein